MRHFEGRMHLDIEELADRVSVLEKFTLGLKGFQVDSFGFNGFALSEVPNFLHLF